MKIKILQEIFENKEKEDDLKQERIEYLNKEIDRTYGVFNQMTSAIKYFYTVLWTLLWIEWALYYKVLTLNNISLLWFNLQPFNLKLFIIIIIILLINFFYLWLLSTLIYINRLREWAMSWYVKAERCLNLELRLNTKYTDIKSYRWDTWNKDYKQWYTPNINIENKAYIIIVLWLILSRFLILSIITINFIDKLNFWTFFLIFLFMQVYYFVFKYLFLKNYKSIKNLKRLKKIKNINEYINELLNKLNINKNIIKYINKLLNKLLNKSKPIFLDQTKLLHEFDVFLIWTILLWISMILFYYICTTYIFKY